MKLFNIIILYLAKPNEIFKLETLNECSNSSQDSNSKTEISSLPNSIDLQGFSF